MSKNQVAVTKDQAVQGLLSNFKEEVGYKEGKNNRTKYAEDYFPSLQNAPWCDTFVDSMFVKTFGRENAEKMLGGFSAYTPTSKNLYSQNGRWNEAESGYIPEPGDQIFFQPKGGRINHTGIVTRVDKENGIVYTIEGNTSAKPGDREGTTVREKSYSLNNERIRGYGTPDWGVTLGHELTESQSKEPNQKTTVRQWQSDLKRLGYKGLDGKDLAVDGIVGKNTEHAIRAFQEKHGLEADGIVGPKTLAALEKAIVNNQQTEITKKTEDQVPSSVTRQEKKSEEQTEKTKENLPEVDKGVAQAEVDKNKIAPDAPKINLDLSVIVQLPVALLKGIESLVNKIGEILPVNINITLGNNISLYCANKCVKEGLALDNVGKVSLEQTDTGKNLVCMTSTDGQQFVTADMNKGMQIPAEQSAEAISQQYTQQQQQQAIEQQQQKSVAVSA